MSTSSSLHGLGENSSHFMFPSTDLASWATQPVNFVGGAAAMLCCVLVLLWLIFFFCAAVVNAGRSEKRRAGFK